jgi:hypothetical protein
MMKKTTLAVIWMTLSAICLTACGGGSQTVSEKYPGTKDGARALLQEFMKPDADRKKLTMELRPTKEDYRAFYADESTAARAETYFDKLWSGGNAVVAPKEGQTELKLVSATTEELKNSQGEASEFPGGLVSLASTDNIKPNLTIHAFKFVKPGESMGMAFEGLTHVNGHWRLFPKPWRFMEGG